MSEKDSYDSLLEGTNIGMPERWQSPNGRTVIEVLDEPDALGFQLVRYPHGAETRIHVKGCGYVRVDVSRPKLTRECREPGPGGFWGTCIRLENCRNEGRYLDESGNVVVVGADPGAGEESVVRVTVPSKREIPKAPPPKREVSHDFSDPYCVMVANIAGAGKQIERVCKVCGQSGQAATALECKPRDWRKYDDISSRTLTNARDYARSPAVPPGEGTPVSVEPIAFYGWSRRDATIGAWSLQSGRREMELGQYTPWLLP